jgi:uncharacterized protein YjbI with pentapeptide repeats
MTVRFLVALIAIPLTGAITLTACSPTGSSVNSAPDVQSPSVTATTPEERDQTDEPNETALTAPVPNPLPTLIFSQPNQTVFPPQPAWSEFEIPESAQERAESIPLTHDYLDANGNRKSCDFQPGAQCNEAVFPANLSGSDLRGSIFRGAKICGDRLMIAVDLRGSDLRNVCGGQAASVPLGGQLGGQASVDATNWSNSRFNDSRMQRADFLNAVLVNVDLSGANLMNSRLQGADLSGARLVRADLSGANASYAQFDSADLRGADFRGADLRHASFKSSDLSSADFRGANLDFASFESSNVTGADFRGADIRVGMSSDGSRFFNSNNVDWSRAKTNSSTKCERTPDSSGACVSPNMWAAKADLEICQIEHQTNATNIQCQGRSYGEDWKPAFPIGASLLVVPRCQECPQDQWVTIDRKDQGAWVTVARGPLGAVESSLRTVLDASRIQESQVGVPTAAGGKITYRMVLEHEGVGRPRLHTAVSVRIDPSIPALKSSDSVAESPGASMLLDLMQQAAARKRNFAHAFTAANQIWSNALASSNSSSASPKNYAWLRALWEKAQEAPNDPYSANFLGD